MKQSKEYAHQYYLKNRARVRKRVAKYAKLNKAAVNATCRAWKQKNRDKVKNTELKQNFGITLDEYQIMLKAQQNRCAICKTHKDELGISLSVDHCHNTGKIRGLLCRKCNTAIGMLNDCPDLLANALKYLKS